MNRRLTLIVLGGAVLAIAVVLLYSNHAQSVAISALEEKVARLGDHCAFEAINLRWLTRELASDDPRERHQSEYDFTGNFRRHFFEFTPCSTYRPNLDQARACIEQHDRECMRRIAAGLSAGMDER